MKILIVEDHESLRDTLSLLLESYDHKVFAVSSVEEGVAILCKETVDLLLTDLKLGQRSGEEIIEFVRAMDPPGRSIPIYLMTAHIGDAAFARVRSQVDHVLIKPFPLGKLVSLVASFSGAKKRGSVREED